MVTRGAVFAVPTATRSSVSSPVYRSPKKRLSNPTEPSCLRSTVSLPPPAGRDRDRHEKTGRIRRSWRATGASLDDVSYAAVGYAYVTKTHLWR